MEETEPNKISEEPDQPLHLRDGTFKVVLVGASSVGKSSLLMQLCDKKFEVDKSATVGAAFMGKTICINNDTAIRMEIWDTAGQERYSSLLNIYYRGSKAAIIVYDITDETSYKKAKEFISEVQRVAGLSVTIAVAGNKTDLKQKRAVTTSVWFELSIS